MDQKYSILYIDDEPLNVMLFEINFRKSYKVITAQSGYEGLEKLNTNKDIRIVLTDMKMPGMNGVEFISEAKKDFPDLTYFILTGYDIIHEIAEALQSNMVKKYFCKPFNVPEIKKAIEDVLVK
jgi:YesN/AraC family two-component response regulator